MEKIAIIADIHGNYYALKAVLDDIEKKGINKIYCLGDLYAPYASEKIWPLLEDIPTVIGNGDSRLLRDDWDSERFLIARNCNRKISNRIKNEIEKMPMTIFLEDLNTILCHGIPEDNNDFLIYEDKTLNRITEKYKDINIVAGHSHRFHMKKIYGRKYITVGSTGLYLENSIMAEYAILTGNRKEINVERVLLEYDNSEQVQDIINQDFINSNGPLGYLAFDELVTHDRRFLTFFSEYMKGIDPGDDLMYHVINYLKSIDRWDFLQQYIKTKIEL